jgi:CDP-diacylglycerol pyrophosphatase
MSTTNLNSHHAQQSTNVATISNQQQLQQQQQQATTIIVKKDVAIDPGDSNNIPVEHYGLISLKIAAAVKKAQQQNHHHISSMKNKSPSSANVSNIAANIEHLQYPMSDRSPPPFKIYTTSSSSSTESNFQQQIQEDILRYTEKKKRIAENNQRPTSSSAMCSGMENGQQQQQYDEDHEKHSRFPEALSFLTIKEEPLEWSEMEAQVDGKSEIVNIKPESMDEIEQTSTTQQTHEKTSFSPLTCEMCNLKFQVPAAWVRHIESHSEVHTAQQNVPKKRKRTEEVSFYHQRSIKSIFL